MKQLEAKIKSIGKIHAMPRKVYWIGLPESFKDKDRMELFQRDIWVIKFTVDNIAQLENISEFILFINLDITIFAGRSAASIPELAAVTKLIKNISAIKPMHTIVHTTHISPQLKDIFTKASITYIEKNLQDTNAAMSTVMKTVNFVYEKMNRTNRAFLRIELEETDKIAIKCTVKIVERLQIIDGFISDLSLNGLQIHFNEESKVKIFTLKDFIELHFLLGHHTIKIHKALIARIDLENKSIGVFFDIHNEKMVKNIYSEHYTEVLFQMLKEFQKNEEIAIK